MKTVRDTLLEKLNGTRTLAAFEAGGKDEFDYYFNYAQHNEATKAAHFQKLGVPSEVSVHDTHNAYCAWGTK